MPLGCASVGNARTRADRDVGTPQRVAVSIERLLVWAYRVQRADRMATAVLLDAEAAAAGVRRLGSSRDGTAAAARAGRLWCDPRFPPAAPGQLHRDAELIHEEVSRLRAYLAILYARRDERPDWVPLADCGLAPVFKAEQAWTEAGAPEPGSFAIQYDRNRKPWLCPIEPIADPAFVQTQRDEWRQWRESLAALRRALRSSARLSRYAVTEELPEAEPWRSRPYSSLSEAMRNARG